MFPVLSPLAISGKRRNAVARTARTIGPKKPKHSEIAQPGVAQPLRLPEHGALLRARVVVDRLVQRAQALFELRRGGGQAQGGRQHVRQQLVFGMRHEHVLADGSHRRIEDLVLDMLMDLELVGEKAQDVAPLRILALHPPDLLEEPAKELVMLEKHLVGLACAGRGIGGRAPARLAYLLRRQRLVPRFRHAGHLHDACPHAGAVPRLRRGRWAVEDAARPQAEAGSRAKGGRGRGPAPSPRGAAPRNARSGRPSRGHVPGDGRAQFPSRRAPLRPRPRRAGVGPPSTGRARSRVAASIGVAQERRTARAADVALMAGSAGAVAAAASGLADWRQIHGKDRRTGLAHVAINTTALGLSLGSAGRWRPRWRDGRRGRPAPPSPRRQREID
jgi:hypothetical protein